MRNILDYIEKIKQENEGPRITAQGPRNMADGGRIGFAGGYGVADSKQKLDRVIGAYRRYRRGEKNPKLNFQRFFEIYAKENFATGGSAGQLVTQLVTPNPDGSRPGYAPQPGWKKEKEKFFKWLADNPDYDFANSSAPEIIKKSGTKFEVGTIQKFLNEKGIQTKHSIARGQETPKYTKKVLAELRKDLPAGISVEQGRPGKYYFRIMLKGGKAGKETYRNSMVANEANKKLIIEDFNRVSKEYYPGRLTDQEFKDLRLKHKDMTTKQFAKFLEGEGKTTYLGDKWNKSSVSRLQSKLDIGVGTTGPLTIRTVDEAKKIIRQHPGAKFFFLGNPTDSEITQYASDLVSREKLSGKGGKKGFPIGGTKEGKMFRNFYDSSLKADGRMELLTDVPTDADGNIDWKMKDKNGVHVWKKAKFYDNKTGATFTWLDKKGNYNPGDLRKQVDAAYHDGFFAKSVKTYDDQAKLNKMTFKGRSLNEWMREGLLKKELEIKLDRPLTNSKADKKLLKEFYALRKPSFSFTEAHHVEGVGKNPFRMEVSYRAANREQNFLLNKYKAGNLTKTEYATAMENLSDTKGGIKYKTDGRFIGQTGTPEKIIATSAKDAGLLKNKDFIKFFKGTFQGLSPQSVLQMAKTHKCGGLDEGGSIISCLQTKFEKNPEKFLQRSAPLAKGNPNLRKWFMRGRNIAKGTGVFALWEAAFAPLLMGWMATEGESWDRMKHDISWGPLWEAIGVSPKFVPGISVEEEWMKAAGGHEGAYTAKRMEELGEQELPHLQYQLEEAQKQSAPTRAKMPNYISPKEQYILDDIKEKELEFQDIWNKAGFMEGPAGGAVWKEDPSEYFNMPKIKEAYAIQEAADAKVIADKAARKEKYRDWGILADPDWYKQEGRISRMGGGRAGYMGGGIAAIRKPSAIAPTGGPQSQGLASTPEYGTYNKEYKWQI
jgi:hypothetical protein